MAGVRGLFDIADLGITNENGMVSVLHYALFMHINAEDAVA